MERHLINSIKPWMDCKVLVMLTGLLISGGRIGSISWAQLTTDQDPPGIRWKTIHARHVDLIFPPEIEPDARRVASSLDHFYPFMGKSLDPYPRLSLVLHNRHSISNGFVAYFPIRSEWWHTPPQDGFLGWMDWYEALAIHEFRHVSQLNHYNRGFNRLLYYGMGELGPGVMEAFSLPTWLLEGDAVGMETFLSNSGRGRLPQFDVELRRNLIYNHIPSYDQAILGSYRHWFPLSRDYVLGYYLCTYLRRHHGGQIIRTALNRTSTWPFVPHAFSLSLRSLTGQGCPGIYRSTMNEIGIVFSDQIKDLPITPAQSWTLPRHSDWTYYSFPHYITPDSAVILRYGLDDFPEFVLFRPSTGEFSELFKPGPIDRDVPFSVSRHTMVWAETRYDKRWGNQAFSVIMSYDFINQHKNQLTHRSRYYAPALSPDGKTIAAVEFDIYNHCRLCLLDRQTGHLIQDFENPDNLLLRTPCWSPDGKSIIYTITRRSAGTGLAQQFIDQSSPVVLMPCSTLTISNPVASNDYIFFSSGLSGIDNIYTYRLADGNVFQVTRRTLGAYYPSLSPDGTNLVFCDVDDQGYSPAEMPIAPDQWTALDQTVIRPNDYYQPCIAQEAGRDVTADIPHQTYAVENYSASKNLLHFHSWYLLPVSQPAGWSVSLNSQNVMGTCQVTGGMEFDTQEDTRALTGGFSYAGWYPILDFNAIYGERSSTYTDPAGNHQSYSWKEKGVITGLRIPLNLTDSHYQSFLTAGVNWEYRSISRQEYRYDSDNPEGIQHNLTGYFHFTSAYQGMKDIYPIRGHDIFAGYTSTPWGGDYQGRRLIVSSHLYLPGLFRHHGWRLDLDYERQEPKNYIFDSRLVFSRGYDSRYYPDLYKISLNYAFPLFYPEMSLLHSIYSKRIHANLFGDYLRGEWGDRSVEYPSMGIELFSETYFLHLRLPIYLGIRWVYLTKSRESLWEWVFYL